MTTTQDNPTLPCGGCGKRHVRPSEDPVRRTSGDDHRGGRGGGARVAAAAAGASPRRAILFLAALAMATATTTSHASAVAGAFPAGGGGGGAVAADVLLSAGPPPPRPIAMGEGGRRVMGRLAAARRHLQAATAEEDDHEEEDEDHDDHDDEEEDEEALAGGLFEQEVKDHDEHDHAVDGHDYDEDHNEEVLSAVDVEGALEAVGLDHEDEDHDEHDDHDEDEDEAHDEDEDHDDHDEDEDHDEHDEDEDHDDHDEDHDDHDEDEDHDDHGEDEEHDDHDEDEDHDDHDSHDDHDLEEEHDDHDDHDSHDVHSSNDDHSSHGGHSSHDDHSSHDVSSLSSAESAQQKLPWGPVIGATLLVNLATLSGCLIVVVAFLHRGWLKMQGEDTSGSTLVGHGRIFDICIPAFAVGALVATAVFLIFPEALHLIEGAHASHGEGGGDEEDHSGHNHRYLQEDEHDEEGANAAKFGCAILAGFLLPFVFAIFFHHTDDAENVSVPAEEECESCADVEATIQETARLEGSAKSAIIKKIDDGPPQDGRPADAIVEGGVPVAMSSEQETAPLVEKTFVNRQLCASILLGDAFHNFADGVFIGAAFKSCSTSVAMSIIFVTLFHEIAQELADFVLLTRYAGLSIIKACVLNFLSGLSVCLGGIVFLAANPTDEATGIILAMAGGVYINIAACETVPRVDAAVKGRMDRVWTLIWVIVGTVPIGLILLNHQHCG